MHIEYIYLVGIVIWPFLWLALLKSPNELISNRLFYLPFLMCVTVLGINFLLLKYYPVAASAQLEQSLFHFLDGRSSNVIKAISSILMISAVAYGIGDRKFPTYFIRFISATFVAIVGFSTPLIWITQPSWLPILRAYQTIPFTFGIFFAVTSILILLKDVMFWMDDTGKAEMLANESLALEKEKNS